MCLLLVFGAAMSSPVSFRALCLQSPPAPRPAIECQKRCWLNNIAFFRILLKLYMWIQCGVY